MPWGKCVLKRSMLVCTEDVIKSQMSSDSSEDWSCVLHGLAVSKRVECET